MTGREDLLVELVDYNGAAVGACSVARAHSAPGYLHRAFSVLLYDGAGQVLLQRRAAAKTRFASLWSNSCCGHPLPGEDVIAAATRRLAAELGISPGQLGPLTESGIFRYRASDAASGRVEHEWDHVLTATLLDGALAPDDHEVSGVGWMPPDALRADIAADPAAYTPWLPGVLGTAMSAFAGSAGV